MNSILLALGLALAAWTAGCAKQAASAKAEPTLPAEPAPSAPHGGALVALGDESYQLEFVRDATAGKLTLYVFDGELENFVRSAAAGIEVTLPGRSPDKLELAAVANSATGEAVGDSAMFEAQAEWLKTTDRLDGVLKTITLRGRTFSGVAFQARCQGGGRDR